MKGLNSGVFEVYRKFKFRLYYEQQKTVLYCLWIGKHLMLIIIPNKWSLNEKAHELSKP